MRLIDADRLWLEMASETAGYCYPCDMMWKAIENTPTVDAVPVRHGKWIYGNEFHWYAASCSRCGYKRTTDIKAANWNAWKYCPNCGARMDADD